LVQFCVQGDDAAGAGSFCVHVVGVLGQFVHVGIEDHSCAEAPEGLHHAFCDIHSLGVIGTGQGFIHEDQAMPGGIQEDLVQTFRFLAQAAFPDGHVLVGREMRIESVNRTHCGSRCQDEQTSLKEKIADAYGERIDGFAAAIGAGDEEDPALLIQTEVVRHHFLLRRLTPFQHMEHKIQMVDALYIGLP